MKTYVISMKFDETRRKQITEECLRHGIDFEFIDAVDGRTLTDDEIKKHVLEPEKCGLIKNEIACTLSHHLVYRKMLAENIERALIFEDDAFMGNNINEVISEIESYDSTSKRANMYLLTKVDKYIENFGNIKLNSVNLYKIHRAGMSQAYIINRKTAETLASLYPLTIKSDNWIYVKFATNIHIYCVMPYLVEDYRGTVSIIGDIDKTYAQRTAYHRKRLYRNPFRWLKIMAYRLVGRRFMKIVAPEKTPVS